MSARQGNQLATKIPSERDIMTSLLSDAGATGVPTHWKAADRGSSWRDASRLAQPLRKGAGEATGLRRDVRAELDPPWIRPPRGQVASVVHPHGSCDNEQSGSITTKRASFMSRATPREQMP